MAAKYKSLYIVVNYFSEEDVSKFIFTHLAKQTIQNLKIIIVNNGCHNINILEKIAKRDQRIELLTPQNNLGYFGAAKFAYEHYLKTFPIPDFTVLSNVDLIFEKENDLVNLFGKSNSDADVIGPNLLSIIHHSPLNPFFEKRISKLKLKFYASVFKVYPLYIFFQTLSLIPKYLMKFRTTMSNKSRFVYAVHGAIIVFRKSYFEKGGSFNYGCFLFGEELFVAEVARKYSLKVFFNADVKVIHNEHLTTRTYKKRQYVLWRKESLSYILANYFK